MFQLPQVGILKAKPNHHPGHPFFKGLLNKKMEEENLRSFSLSLGDGLAFARAC